MTNGILSRNVEGFFIRCLQEILLFEKDLEIQKINLSLREDFNLIDAFGILDTEGRGTMSPSELFNSLKAHNLVVTQEDCHLFFLRYNKDVDCQLKYSEFKSAFTPMDNHYARQLGSRKLQYCHENTETTFCHETMRHFMQIWGQMIRAE